MNGEEFEQWQLHYSRYRLEAAEAFLAEVKALRIAMADERAWMLANHDPGDEDRS
jgi:hypothetical protein